MDSASKGPLSTLLGQQGVVDIEVQELDEIFNNSDPSDKGHEGMPNALRSMTLKDIASVNIVFGIKADNLLDLQAWMYWHVPVGLRNIGLPENHVKIRLLLSKIVKGIA